jgi:polysaccharide biosynthesis transport protein
MDAITSTPVLEDAAASLKLDQDPDFNPAARTEDGGDVTRGVFERLSSALAAVPGAVRNFLSPAAFDDPHLDVLSSLALALDVSVKAGTRSISLKATANDPRKAADLANAVAEAAVRRDLAIKVENTRRTDAWLADSLAELRARVSRGEEEVNQLRANTGRFEGQTATISSEQLSNISRELLDARTQLSAARAAREEIARLGSTLDGLSGTDEVLSSVTIHSLREQESKLSGDLAAAQGHLGPQHPSLISMKAQLADVRDKIAAEIGRISSEVLDRIRRKSFQVTELKRAQTQLESRIEGQSATAARLAALQNDTDSDRATYEAFAIFRAKTAGLLTTERPDIEIVSPALPWREPSWPKRKVVLVATALGVSCLGFFISVLRVSLDQGLRSAEQIGVLLGLPTAALIPRVPGRLGPAEAVLAAPSSALAESIRYLFTAVEAARGGQTGFKVLISSALPQEGKSSTALMLARQAALVGIRTLLVRLDLRRPPRPASADADYAVDVADDADSGMSILNVFSRNRETFKALFLRAFWDQLQDACHGYDLVVIDSPPVLSVSDAKIIARFSDMTIFLVKWGSTKAALAGEALRQLRLADGNAHCVVLTQVNPRLYATYGYDNPASGLSGNNIADMAAEINSGHQSHSLVCYECITLHNVRSHYTEKCPCLRCTTGTCCVCCD